MLRLNSCHLHRQAPFASSRDYSTIAASTHAADYYGSNCFTAPAGPVVC
jgi:hypothetical protein